MIADKLQQMIGEALKAHDEVRLSTLRLLSSAFNYEFIAKQHKLDELEEMAVIQKEAKKRKEAIEAYKKAGATDRAEKEAQELKVLQEFLPPEISDEQLAKLVEETIKTVGVKSIADMGKVIGAVKGKAPSADGAKIVELVKAKLQQ